MSQYYIVESRLKAVRNELLDGHISYRLGAKARLDAEPSTITHLDCSGFVRYLLYQASDKSLLLPDGSWIQREWCQKQKLEPVNYATAAECDGWLRIAFIDPKPNKAGHVWLIRNGQTLESHGRRIGPNQRPWDTPVLQKGVGYCFKLAVLSEQAWCPLFVRPSVDACYCD